MKKRQSSEKFVEQWNYSWQLHNREQIYDVSVKTHGVPTNGKYWWTWVEVTLMCHYGFSDYHEHTTLVQEELGGRGEEFIPVVE